VGYTREKHVSAAERMREQMRRDMLTDLDGEEEDDGDEGLPPGRKAEEEEADMEGVDWEEMVSPTKRVLSMDVSRFVERHSRTLMRIVACFAPSFPHLAATA